MEIKQYQQVPKSHVIISQVIPTFVKNIIMLIIGMGNAFPTILIPSLSSDNTFNMNEEEISWIASLNLICVLCGASVSGVITEKVGRKRLMQILNIPLIVCWLTYKFATLKWQIFFSLAVFGVVHGLIESPVLSYVGEIAQPQLRGILSVSNALSVIIGILIQFGLGASLSWRNSAAVACAGPVLAFTLLFFIPESPHWLVSRNRFDEAKKSLAWVRGWTTTDMVEEEFQEMCQGHCIDPNLDIRKPYPTKKCCDVNFKNLRPYTNKKFYWPFSLISFLCVIVIFSGIWTMQVYAVNLFSTFQVPLDKYYSTLILGVAQVLGCITNLLLVRRFGKRSLAFVSLAGVAISNCGIGVYAYLTNTNSLVFDNDSRQKGESTEYSWIPLVLCPFLSFIGLCGARALPWILIGEVFTHETRATGCGLISALFNGLGFVANKTYLNLISTLTLPGAFWFNGGIAVVGLIVLYFTLPETEGKSLDDIINHFSGISKLNNKVKRKT